MVSFNCLEHCEMNDSAKHKMKARKGSRAGESYRVSRKFNRVSWAVREGFPIPRLTTSQGVLFQMDCLDFLPLVASESVHCVFADPPFNLNKKYGNGFSDDARTGSCLLGVVQSLDRGVLSSTRAWRSFVHLRSSEMGIPLCFPAGWSVTVPTLDRTHHEGDFSKREETVPGALRPTVLYERRAACLQSHSVTDPDLPPMRERHQGLRWSPKDT